MGQVGKTALVTGANSGIGFEAAAQLAEAGWRKVILACRSREKGDVARAQLVERVGSDPFDTLVMDTSLIASATAAADTLRDRSERIDFLVLNAGASHNEASFNDDGFEVTYASTLIGHHILTMRALQDGLLSSTARIVIAGSEGARGNMPGMNVHDIHKIATDSFGGDMVAAIEAMFRLKVDVQKPFSNMSEYVTAKMLVAWWTTALSRKLPAGMTVNAVSPGGVADTGFARHASAVMRIFMVPMMKLVGGLMGMNGTVGQAASRYVEAEKYGADANGNFYATEHKSKTVGPVAIQTWPEFFGDRDGQEAALSALVNLTGVAVPA